MGNCIRGPTDDLPDNLALFGEQLNGYKFILVMNRQIIGVYQTKTDAIKVFDSQCRKHDQKITFYHSEIYNTCELNTHIWLSVITDQKLLKYRGQEKTALLDDLYISPEGSV